MPAHRVEQPVLEFEDDGEIHLAALALRREAPVVFQLPERAFRLRDVDLRALGIEHDAAGVAFAQGADSRPTISAVSNVACRVTVSRDSTRSATTQGRNSGYFSTSATTAYIRSAVYGTMRVSRMRRVMPLATASRAPSAREIAVGVIGGARQRAGRHHQEALGARDLPPAP